MRSPGRGAKSGYSGLKITTQRRVPESNLKAELLKEWNEVLPGTSRALLKLLKIYHRRMDSILAGKIAALRARLQNRQDFTTTIRKIDGFTKKVVDEYENKRAKKTKHLFRDKSNIRKQCRKKKHHKQNQSNRESDHSTVAGISNVPTLSSEKDLLLRGLSFFSETITD